MNPENVDLDVGRVKNFKTYLEFQEMRRKLRPLFEVLNRSPENEFEKKLLLTEGHSETQPTASDLENAEVKLKLFISCDVCKYELGQ